MLGVGSGVGPWDAHGLRFGAPNAKGAVLRNALSKLALVCVSAQWCGSKDATKGVSVLVRQPGSIPPPVPANVPVNAQRGTAVNTFKSDNACGTVSHPKSDVAGGLAAVASNVCGCFSIAFSFAVE